MKTKKKKIGIFYSSQLKELYPSCPKDAKSSWLITMPNMYDSLDCLQINNRYIFSAGVHATHHNLLLSAKYKANYSTIMEIENFTSYIFDTICHISHPESNKMRNSYLKGIKSYFNLLGKPIRNGYTDIDSYLSDKADIIWESVDDAYMRLMPFSSSKRKDSCPSCNMPNSKKMKIAFSVYRQALSSPEPTGMILNYWRVLEAVTTINERYNLIKNLRKIKLFSVKCYHPIKNYGLPWDNSFNLMTKYRKYALNYLKQLLNKYHSYEKIIDHYYKNRRCPSAHAKDNILGVNEDINLASLYKDTILLKYLARCAIEKYWQAYLDKN